MAVLLGFSVACSSEWNSPNRCAVCYPPRYGEQLGVFEKANGVFFIRTLVYREKTMIGGGALLGAHYIFETKFGDKEDWREFMMFRHDNPEPIGGDREKFVNDRVVFVNDRVAFVFIGWMFAVTTDAGRSWNLWDGLDCRFPSGRMGYDGIQSVELAGNGVGVMKINLIGNDAIRELRTADYGISWASD